MEPDTTETLTVETQKETPQTVNESTNTHMHRQVQHKRTVALCAGDPRTVHFAEEQQHEQKTTRSRLATTGKVKDQGSLLGTVYTHTGHSPWRSSAYRQKAAFLMHCKYLLAHCTNIFSSTRLRQSKVRPLLVMIAYT